MSVKAVRLSVLGAIIGGGAIELAGAGVVSAALAAGMSVPAAATGAEAVTGAG